MKCKPIVARVVAQRDVEEAIDHYLDEASEQGALGFIAALERAYAHIARHPVRVFPVMRTNWTCLICAHGH